MAVARGNEVALEETVGIDSTDEINDVDGGNVCVGNVGTWKRAATDETENKLGWDIVEAITDEIGVGFKVDRAISSDWNNKLVEITNSDDFWFTAEETTSTLDDENKITEVGETNGSFPFEDDNDSSTTDDDGVVKATCVRWKTDSSNKPSSDDGKAVNVGWIVWTVNESAAVDKDSVDWVIVETITTSKSVDSTVVEDRLIWLDRKDWLAEITDDKGFALTVEGLTRVSTTWTLDDETDIIRVSENDSINEDGDSFSNTDDNGVVKIACVGRIADWINGTSGDDGIIVGVGWVSNASTVSNKVDKDEKLVDGAIVETTTSSKGADSTVVKDRLVLLDKGWLADMTDDKGFVLTEEATTRWSTILDNDPNILSVSEDDSIIEDGDSFSNVDDNGIDVSDIDLKSDKRSDGVTDGKGVTESEKETKEDRSWLLANKPWEMLEFSSLLDKEWKLNDGRCDGVGVTSDVMEGFLTNIVDVSYTGVGFLTV